MNTELWFLLVLCYRQGFKQYHNFTPEAGEGSWEQSKITRNWNYIYWNLRSTRPLEMYSQLTRKIHPTDSSCQRRKTQGTGIFTSMDGEGQVKQLGPWTVFLQSRCRCGYSGAVGARLQPWSLPEVPADPTVPEATLSNGLNPPHFGRGHF